MQAPVAYVPCPAARGVVDRLGGGHEQGVVRHYVQKPKVRLRMETVPRPALNEAQVRDYCNSG